jgi:spore coat protein CotF
MLAIDAHEKITNYMVNKNYYYPYDIPKQLQMDLQAIDKLTNSGN